MLVCCPGWRSVLCVLDQLQHLLLDRGDQFPTRPLGLVCRLHDWAIGMSWREAGS